MPSQKRCCAAHTHTPMPIKTIFIPWKAEVKWGKAHDFAFASFTVMNFVIISSNINHDQDPAASTHTHTHARALKMNNYLWCLLCRNAFQPEGSLHQSYHNYRDITNVCIETNTIQFADDPINEQNLLKNMCRMQQQSSLYTNAWQNNV